MPLNGNNDSDDSYEFDESDDLITFGHKCHQCTVLYLDTSVPLEALPNSINPKDPISEKTL